MTTKRAVEIALREMDDQLANEDISQLTRKELAERRLKSSGGSSQWSTGVKGQ